MLHPDNVCAAVRHAAVQVRSEALGGLLLCRAVPPTCELPEGRVRHEVEALPVLVEGLHAKLPGLLYGPQGHFGHHSVYVVAPAYLWKTIYFLFILGIYVL